MNIVPGIEIQPSSRENRSHQHGRDACRKNEPQRTAFEGKIQSAIAKARKRERAELKSKVAELASSHGFSVSELFGDKVRAKSKGIAKYANPDDPTDTWSGRGRKPNWLVARLKKGAKLSESAG
jgi:DNA-binding protein H-NS